MVETVRLHEVGPRDGLQNEPGIIAADRKIALIELLARAGLRDIEVGAFVSPKWVPQMANSADVMRGLSASACTYGVLVPNMHGWDRFIDVSRAGTYEVAVFISASEGFSQANLNCSIAQSVARLAPVVAAANEAGISVRGYVSCVVECPFDGAVAPSAVAHAVGMLRDVAPMQISLGDTLGRAQPAQIVAMLDAVADVVPVEQLAGHYHDTSGRALDNIEASLALGVRAFDSAVGGLGGCPYAPGAPGNVATEAVLERLAQLGYETGIDAAIIAQAAKMAKEMRG